LLAIAVNDLRVWASSKGRSMKLTITEKYINYLVSTATSVSIAVASITSASIASISSSTTTSLLAKNCEVKEKSVPSRQASR